MSTPRRDIVEAGAGCGKTYGLVSRYLEALGVDPESGKSSGPQRSPSAILALTFTEDAAREMKERVIDRLARLGRTDLVESVLERAQIGTFHGLCLKLLAPSLGRLGYDSSTVAEPAVAREARERHVVSVLSSHPDRDYLLEHAPLKTLTALGGRLWFKTNARKETSTDRWADTLARVETFRTESRALLRNALTSNPDFAAPEAGNWLLAFDRALDAPSSEAADEISFTKFRKASKEHPDLKRRAELWRAFLDKGAWEAVGPDALREEDELQARFEAFFGGLRASGPHVLDFEALEAELVEWLRAHPGERLMPAPEVLLVDEFQDTNRSQLEILTALSAPTTEWYLVGDPKQSIYKFRGAEADLFGELCERLDHRVLEDNWRSEPPALEFMNRLQESLFVEGRPYDPPAQPLHSGPHERKRDALLADWPAAVAAPLRVLEIAKGESTTSALAEAYRRRVDELGPTATHAALFTSWRGLFEAADSLRAAGIPYSIAGNEPWLDHHLTAIFLDALEWSDAPAETPAGLQSLLRWGALTAAVTEDHLRAHFAVDSTQLSWSGFFLQFTAWVRPARWERGAVWAAAMARVVAGLEASALGYSLNRSELARFLKRYRDTFEINVDSRVEAAAPATRLVLQTIHGSKGLQFDAVYLPQLVERGRGGAGTHLDDEGSALFNIKRVHVGDDGRREDKPSMAYLARERRHRAELEAESRRLLYVAATRTRRTLDIILRTPSAKSSTTVDPFGEILGWPALEPTYWNTLLVGLRAKGALDALETGGHLTWDTRTAPDVADSDEATPPAEERWRLPAEPVAPPAARPFFREGVSRYIARRNPAPASPSAGVSDRQRAAGAVSRDLGEQFHGLLEIWNGSADTLDALLPAEHTDTFRAAALELRALPALAPIWQAIESDSAAVQREFGLYLLGPSVRLSGYADLIFFAPDEILIVDWKTGSRMSSLAAQAKVDLVRAQLQIYANAFAGRRCRGLAVAVDLGDRPPAKGRVRVILDDVLSATNRSATAPDAPLARNNT